jgi:hypothetical protein
MATGLIAGAVKVYRSTTPAASARSWWPARPRPAARRPWGVIVIAGGNEHPEGVTTPVNWSARWTCCAAPTKRRRGRGTRAHGAMDRGPGMKTTDAAVRLRKVEAGVGTRVRATGEGAGGDRRAAQRKHALAGDGACAAE